MFLSILQASNNMQSVMIGMSVECWRNICDHEVHAIERSKVDTSNWTAFHFHPDVGPLPNFLFNHIRGGR